MKNIEEFCRMIKYDIEKQGCIDHSNKYLIKLDQDDLIKHIEFGNTPTEKYLKTCSAEEKELIMKWLEFKLGVMKGWADLYNESVKKYNDYCGKRAGESDNLFNLVIKGYSIANVLPFKPKKSIKQ